MSTYRYTQVDVFTSTPLSGSPLAVVHAATSLDAAQMAALARWTHLSETAFLLPPTDPGADYRVRIFTPDRELPFAGHPTLGSCHAWLAAGGRPRHGDAVVQECGLGLIRIRRDADRLAFAAPPRLRAGPLDDALLGRLRAALGLAEGRVVSHQWVDNGPGWCALRLDSAAAVLAVRPDWRALAGCNVGLVGSHPDGGEVRFEVRALIGADPGYEDPVTGSLNASLAQWLIETGAAPGRYVAAQGTRLDRAGRVFVELIGTDVWIGGGCTTRIEGELTL